MEHKKVDFDTLLLLGLFIGSMLFSPIAHAVAADGDEIDDPDEVAALTDSLGQVFGMFRGFGAQGETLGQVLQLMFTNFTDLTGTMKQDDGVYVLSSSIKNIDPRVVNFTYDDGVGTHIYQPWGIYRDYYKDNASGSDVYEEPYFKYENLGDASAEYIDGASLTIIIWDSDGSFINALDELIHTVQDFIDINESGDSNTEKGAKAISRAVETITYFLIHINDIINGDEVIICNLIGFTNLQLSIEDVNWEWYVTEDGQYTDTILLNETYADYATDYRAIAESIGDTQMIQLLDYNLINKAEFLFRNYTMFSFDVIEIWLKNFHIEIDVAALLEAVTSGSDEPLEGKKAADIFQGLDIEFYVFTHHFQNWYLYDDAKFNDPLYSGSGYDGLGVSALINNGVPDVIMNQTGTYENQSVDKIIDSEVTHYILFRGARDWVFHAPTYEGTIEDGDFKMSWGIEALDLDFRCIPMGLNDFQVNMTKAPIEEMESYYLGFSFSPSLKNIVEVGGWSGEGMGLAKVKLEQEFSEWNDGDGVRTPDVNSTSLDLATVFMTTIFHFHLNMTNVALSEDAPLEEDDPLLGENNYNSETHEVAVGRSAADNDLPLAQIDIAGPDYEQNGTTYPARTNIIPTAFVAYEGESSETYQDTDGGTSAISGVITIEFSVLIYAVSYPTFDSSGEDIWHDPTFSIFITFDSKVAWAIILVVGLVALVGIAALTIAKKKDEAAGKDTSDNKMYAAMDKVSGIFKRKK